MKKFLIALLAVVMLIATSVYAEWDKSLQSDWDALSLNERAAIKGISVEEYIQLKQAYEMKLEEVATLKGMSVKAYNNALKKEKEWYQLPIEEQARQKGMTVVAYKKMINKIKNYEK